MNLNDLICLRSEILLSISILMIVCVDLFGSRTSRNLSVSLALAFLIVNLIVAFVPVTHVAMFGGMYRSSDLIVLMKSIVNAATIIVVVQSHDWLTSEYNTAHATEYVVLLLSTVLGMNFMISAGHFLMFTLGLELATIPLAALTAFERRRRTSSEAAIKFILLAALSTGISLYGLSLVYATCGSMYYDQVSQSFTGSALQVLAFIFFISGLAFKISLVPFHLWTADVYEGAPTMISAFLSVVSKGAAVFTLLILLFGPFRSIVPVWSELMTVLAVATMTVGNLFAIRQQKLKRYLAFSSIAQAGFLLLGVVGASQLGSSSVIYFVAVYVVSNLAAFGCVAAVEHASGKTTIDDLAGLYATNPRISLTLMLALFSLAGIPPAAGFFAKLFLFAAVAERGYYVVLIIATMNATLSLYYYLLVVKSMFITKNENPIPKFSSSSWTRLALVICVSGIIFVGFAAGIFDTIFSLSKGL